MALTECEECGKAVSNLASFCPHCGNPGPTTVENTSVERVSENAAQAFKPVTNSDLTTKPFSFIAALVFGYAALWFGSYGYSALLASDKACAAIAMNASNLYSLTDAFVCVEDSFVEAIEILGVSLNTRERFALLMLCGHLISGFLTWAFVVKGRRAI